MSVANFLLTIQPIDVGIFHTEPQPSVWHERKSQGITKNNGPYPLNTLNVHTKFHESPSNTYLIWIKLVD